MKKLPILIIIIWLFSVSAFAQSAELVDQFANIQCEDLRSRLDNFMIKIQNRPDTYGYVIIYDGKYAYRPYNLNEKIPLKTYLPFFGETNYRTHQIMRHFTLRAFPSNRILFINGGIKEIYQINLWIISKGATPPKPMPTLDKMAYRKDKIEGWDSTGNCL